VIRLVIIDDHALVRAGLRLLLKRDPETRIEAEGGNAHEAVRLTGLHRPRVLLLDLVLPDRDGVEAIPDIRRASPQTRILVLSMLDEQAYLRAAFAAGAQGYLLKDAADVQLLTAVREVAAGRQYVHPSLGARLVGDEDNRTVGDPLSPRERQVLRLVALGYMNREIANMLGISDRTTEAHRTNVARKLTCSSRAELVQHALRRGLLAAAGDTETYSPTSGSRPNLQLVRAQSGRTQPRRTAAPSRLPVWASQG